MKCYVIILLLLLFLVGTYTNPNYCDVDLQGNVFFTSNSGYIYKYPYDNQSSTALKLIGSGGGSIVQGNGLAASIPSPQGISVNPTNNNLLLVTLGSAGTIIHVNLTNGINNVKVVVNGLVPHSFQLTHDVNATYAYVGVNSADAIYRVRISDWTVVVYTGLISTPGKIDGSLSIARFNFPRTVIRDSDNNIYVGDYSNNMVRIIHKNQMVSTLAGSGSSTASLGTGKLAGLPQVASMAISPFGKRFYVLLFGSYIRELSCSGGYNFYNGACYTQLPTFSPTLLPTPLPTSQPSSKPSIQPSSQPSSKPSTQPSSKPTGFPRSQPSSQPSQPSTQPTNQPTIQPTSQPNHKPTSQPSTLPTDQPTMVPTLSPLYKQFIFTGYYQIYTVPQNINELLITCVGAAGGATTSLGGQGGIIKGRLYTYPGQKLYIYVGGTPITCTNGNSVYTGGYNGGGATHVGSCQGGILFNYRHLLIKIDFILAGGGASDVRTIADNLFSRIIVAGAGMFNFNF